MARTLEELDAAVAAIEEQLARRNARGSRAELLANLEDRLDKLDPAGKRPPRGYGDAPGEILPPPGTPSPPTHRPG